MDLRLPNLRTLSLPLLVGLVLSACGPKSQMAGDPSSAFQSSEFSLPYSKLHATPILGSGESLVPSPAKKAPATPEFRSMVQEHVKGQIPKYISFFEKAKDISTFCPGYENSYEVEKQNCWVTLVLALVDLESKFDPAAEFLEPDGKWSVGLLMLSPGECKAAPTKEDLKHATKNLDCGLRIMANRIARDSYISGPKETRGAASYWSTLREPYTFKKYKLGKRPQVIAKTSQYRNLEVALK